MRIAHINVTDGAGGAGIAARRLHTALLNSGIDSWMIVQQKDSDDSRVIGPSKTEEAFTPGRVRAALDRLPLRLRYGSVGTAWNVGWLPNPGLMHRINHLSPDVVVLHWVGSGMMPASMLAKLPCPAVWVLHDMGPLTGGCHYDRGCGRFQTGCGACPILKSGRDGDISRSTFLRKLLALDQSMIVPVAISEWMAELARASLLFSGRQIRTIHHPLDLSLFRPRDRKALRRKLGWSEDRKVVLFGAVNALEDKRKGFPHLKAALEMMSPDELGNSAELRIMGTAEGPKMQGCLPAFYEGSPASQEDLAERFAAADVVVTPSQQEAFGLVAAEAQASGTAVLAFDHGGLRDIVVHGETGYLAPPLQPAGLAEGLRKLLAAQSPLETMGRKARERAQRLYEPGQQAKAYIGIFEELLAVRGAAERARNNVQAFPSGEVAL